MDTHIRAKRKKKLEKEIRSLEKKGERHLKPVEEFEITLQQKQDLRKGYVSNIYSRKDFYLE